MFKSIKKYWESCKFRWAKKYMDTRRLKDIETSDEPHIEIVSTGQLSPERIYLKFNWNNAFIRKCREYGFTGESEDDIVEAWFHAITHKTINDLANEDDSLAIKAKIISDQHPDL